MDSPSDHLDEDPVPTYSSKQESDDDEIAYYKQKCKKLQAKVSSLEGDKTLQEVRKFSDRDRPFPSDEGLEKELARVKSSLRQVTKEKDGLIIQNERLLVEVNDATTARSRISRDFDEYKKKHRADVERWKEERAHFAKSHKDEIIEITTKHEAEMNATKKTLADMTRRADTMNAKLKETKVLGEKSTAKFKELLKALREECIDSEDLEERIEEYQVQIKAYEERERTTSGVMKQKMELFTQLTELRRQLQEKEALHKRQLALLEKVSSDRDTEHEQENFTLHSEIAELRSQLSETQRRVENTDRLARQYSKEVENAHKALGEKESETDILQDLLNAAVVDAQQESTKCADLAAELQECRMDQEDVLAFYKNREEQTASSHEAYVKHLIALLDWHKMAILYPNAGVCEKYRDRWCQAYMKACDAELMAAVAAGQSAEDAVERAEKKLRAESKRGGMDKHCNSHGSS